MTDIRDNPPPLNAEQTNELWNSITAKNLTDHVNMFSRQIEAAAFARGVAAGQAEIDELRAKLKALDTRAVADACASEIRSIEL